MGVDNIGSVRCCVRSKKDNSVLNNVATCDASFYQEFFYHIFLGRQSLIKPVSNVHLSVRPSVCLSVYPSVRVYIHTYVSTSVRPHNIYLILMKFGV